MTEDSAKIALKLAIGAVFAALVWVATMSFIVSVPATTGYFNIGETVIYVAAMLFGPLVGAFAGGVGAAFADALVAPSFVPGTLVIKAFEGAIVGFLNKKMLAKASRSDWKIYTTLLGVTTGLLIAVICSIYYSGEVQLYLGYPQPQNPTLTLFIPFEFWYILGGIIAVSIAYVGIKTEPEIGRAILSMIAGGLEMVVGYFLYEQIVLGKTTAILEIPVNISQMLIGLIVAVPVTRIILRSLPQLKSQS